MSSILPKNTSDFTDPHYWKRFFAQRKAPFEWYGSYADLGSNLEKYLKTSDSILQIGCGSSLLASQMYDNGFRKIHSIDVDNAVIEDQKRRNTARPELSFDVDDASNLKLGSETVSVAVDKGTLDALLPPSSNEQQKELVQKMFAEIFRVLTVGGRYIVITLAQEHLVRLWLEHFINSKQCLVRVEQLPVRSNGFPMPVFFLIVTKLRISLPNTLSVEVIRSSKIEKVEHNDEVLSIILAEQELSRFIHLCSTKLENEVYIDMNSVDGRGCCRYRIHIVDDAQAKDLKSYSVFIVPLGRNGEWIFATEKGRRSLRKMISKDRIMIVVLQRDQIYGSLGDIQDELSGFVTRLDPRTGDKLPRIDFLSLGELDTPEPIANGVSEMNGEWAVEDVVISEQHLRRLIFVSSQNLVQSEVSLKVTGMGKKKKKRVDLDELACDHHSLMIASFGFLPSKPLLNPGQAKLKIAVLGLGGGLLAAYLLRKFTQSNVIGVELDSEVVRIANEYFSFPSADPRMAVHVEDARLFLKRTADSEDKLDVLLVDVAGSIHDDGLSCPPAVFLEADVLETMKNAIKPTGVIAVNLVTRDDELAVVVRRKIKQFFPNMYHIYCEEDVNEVLFCVGSAIGEKFDLKKASGSFPQNIEWIRGIGNSFSKMKVVNC